MMSSCFVILSFYAHFTRSDSFEHGNIFHFHVIIFNIETGKVIQILSQRIVAADGLGTTIS